jgi:hypothetical protein
MADPMPTLDLLSVLRDVGSTGAVIVTVLVFLRHMREMGEANRQFTTLVTARLEALAESHERLADKIEGHLRDHPAQR